MKVRIDREFNQDDSDTRSLSLQIGPWRGLDVVRLKVHVLFVRSDLAFKAATLQLWNLVLNRFNMLFLKWDGSNESQSAQLHQPMP